MEPWITIIVTVVCAVFASNGFWALIQKKNDKNDAKTKMLLGLGHDKIRYLCITYKNRESLSFEEYENLNKYLYAPYKELGGNGSVSTLMEQVSKLPIKGSIDDK